MTYEIKETTTFKKDFRLAKKRGCKMELLKEVIDMLATKKSLPPKNKDHALKGDRSGLRECHIQPDWLLVYYHDDKVLVLHLMQTGTHGDLF